MNAASRILPLRETITPANQAAVAEAVAEAHRTVTAVYPLGGQTGLCYGARPTTPGLGLSLSRLGALIDYPARDLTITVEAGMTVAELGRRLASEGQRLPVDVPQPERATVGGAVATNPSGPRRQRRGTLRDHVIGLRAVDGRGTAFSAGGRVVKNAAGYNLCRLLTGSLGTLAVVTQVTLMIKPAPEASAWAVCELPDWAAAERLLAALVETETLPAAVELLAGPVWADDPALGPPSVSHAVRLAVGFEGTRAEVDWMLDAIRREWASLGVRAAADIRAAAADKLWARLREFASVDPESDAAAPLVAAVHVLPSRVVLAAEHIARFDPGSSIESHAGEGVIRVRFSLPAAEVAIGLEGPLRAAVGKTGGSLVVTSWPNGGRDQAPIATRRMIWGAETEAGGVMLAIKKQFDPAGILNPGRFVY